MFRGRYGRKKLRKSFKRTLPEIGGGRSPFSHMKRAVAELIRDEGVGHPKTIFQAMVVLNELSPTGIYLFAECGFMADDRLTLNIPSLKNFFVKARVVACKEIPVNPGILAVRSFHHRIELEFMFQSEFERDAVRDYCNYLKASYLSSAA